MSYIARTIEQHRRETAALQLAFHIQRFGRLLKNGQLDAVQNAWEAATEPAKQRGMRVVILRLGMVLSAAGGALAKMLPPFRLGLGGMVGSGRQYMSWIALDDAVGAIHHAMVTDALHGPANAVAPQAVTNQEFTKTLGQVLGRPTVLPLPAFLSSKLAAA